MNGGAARGHEPSGAGRCGLAPIVDDGGAQGGKFACARGRGPAIIGGSHWACSIGSMVRPGRGLHTSVRPPLLGTNRIDRKAYSCQRWFEPWGLYRRTMPDPVVRTMSEPPDQWIPLPEAAAHLGIAENALRSRIKRRTIRARKDNHGRLLVCLSGTADRTRTMVRSRFGPGSDHTTEPSAELPLPIQSALETVPLSVHMNTVELIQQTHSAALAASQEQVERVRTDIAQERAESARRLAERDTLHLDAISRMQAQAALERSLWLERVDAAELRAERVEQRLDQVLDHLLRQRPAGDSPLRGWLSRWFGQSKRSDIGGQ